MIDVPDEIRVLHGLDNVMEGGAVVLTLKDQNILTDGDLNEEIFYMIWQRLICLKMWKLESRSVGTRLIRLLRKRWESMMMFIDDPSSEKKILMQYDDLTADEARLTPTPLLPRSLSSFP